MYTSDRGTSLGRLRSTATLVAWVALVAAAGADDVWLETKSAHFTVVSNAGAMLQRTHPISPVRSRS